MQPFRPLAAVAISAAILHVADAFVGRPRGVRRPPEHPRHKPGMRTSSFLSEELTSLRELDAPTKMRQVASSRFRQSNVQHLLELDNHGNTATIGMTAALCEDGYRKVLGAVNKATQMHEFVLRVIQKYDGDVLDEGSLKGMIPFYNGELAVSSYSGLISELIRAPWLAGFKDASKVPLNATGFGSVVSMQNEDEFRAFIRRVIVKHGGTISDESPLFAMANQLVNTHGNGSYGNIVSNLAAADWISNFRSEPDVAFPTSEQLERASTKPPESFEKDTSDNDQLLFIGVFSAPGNFARREEVRNSWMQDDIFKGKQPIVSTKFVIGLSDDADLRFKVEEENRMHGDILFLPVTDTYENLPNKSIAYFRWFSQKHCCLEPSEAHWYVMKLDDDSWPNLDLLLPYIDSVKDTPSSLNYIGGLLWNGPVMREGKWTETAETSLFRLKQYPAYAAGSGYILSMDVARHIDQVALERGFGKAGGDDELPGIVLLRNEDTTIGNFIYQEDHLTMAVNYHDFTFREYGCENGLHVAMNLCPGEMRCMWEKRLNGTAAEDMCCNPPEQYGLPAEGCLPAEQ